MREWAIRLQKLASKKVYVGNCVNILDGHWSHMDATHLAQLVESGKEITMDDFFAIANVYQHWANKIRKKPDRYKFYTTETAVWFYDLEKDIEYFYQ